MQTYEIVADLERALGDPHAPTGPFTFAEIVAHEENDELPPGALDVVRDWGMAAFVVPTPDGGRIRNLESIFALTRSLARRNITVALRYGSSLLGALPVWLWGTAEQKTRVAEGMLHGDLACFGVSEPDHGSDIQANETAVTVDGDEFVLTGQKWPVGNATRGRFVTVLAQAPRFGLTLLLIDKQQLPEDSWSTKPMVRTVGLRGHDLSGIVFHDARIPQAAVIGRPGAGFVNTMKTLQITRTAIGALSVGTMDAALRIGREYAQQRRLYGGPIHDIPVVRDHLVGAHLDLLIAECTALPVARALSVVPSRLSLWSCVVKYLVPVLGEEVMAHIGKVLGARSYLRQEVAGGAFQKLTRDHAVASLFDGTTHVNLHAVASQLGNIAAFAQRPAKDSAAVLKALFDFSSEAPVWQPSGRALQLTNASEDDITRSWADAIAQLPDDPTLKTVVNALDTRRTTFYDRIVQNGIEPNTVAGSRAGAEHCVYHAAASCVQVWLHNDYSTMDWLILTLQRLLQRLEPDTVLDENHLARLEKLMAKDDYFSLASLIS